MKLRLIRNFLLASLMLAWCSTSEGATDAGLHSNVVFLNYPVYARSSELLRRLLSPLDAMAVQRQIEKKGLSLANQPIDPSREHFVLYIPPTPPPKGYGLLVFVFPWTQAELPHGWATQLDRHGVIFVSPANAGNNTDVINQREPLALLAAYGVAQQYRVDPERVYIGGFSGGARVALRLALSYPDVFHGALLDAGADRSATPKSHFRPRICSRDFKRRVESSISPEVTTPSILIRLRGANRLCMIGAYLTCGSLLYDPLAMCQQVRSRLTTHCANWKRKAPLTLASWPVVVIASLKNWKHSLRKSKSL